MHRLLGPLCGPFAAQSRSPKSTARVLAAFALLLASPLTLAFSLDDLQKQLSQPAVVKGPFIQEKHLRALPQPLLSKGRFVLARDHGLLWLLDTPLRQDYRIDAQGIARRDPNGWQTLPSRSAGAEQNRLFFAVLQGDSSGLQRDFELALSGDAGHWQLRLTPRSLLLKQVFTRIDIAGGQYVERIELSETQGDSTVLRMPASTAAAALSDTERSDFAD
ncbi:outer membrane lipoprotein carrier protein LolA [Pseudomonas sp. GZD-209]|uniref:outer membrane lipoprotein carrier protein LolA n=1 Tax=Pseudomonas sp. GZD-209 TaxID=3404807 RepID=UPI003BB5BD1D